MPDVIAVFTAADLALEPVPSRFNPAVARPLLAADRVRFVGEPVAVVVAATAAAAADAADAVIVDYDVSHGLRRPARGDDRRHAAVRRAPGATSSSTARRWACPG